MKQGEFVEWSYEKAKRQFSGLSKTSYSDLVRFVFKALEDAIVEHGSLTIRGFGRFKKVDINRTNAYNPWTKEKMDIKGRRTIRFYASDALKKRISDKR